MELGFALSGFARRLVSWPIPQRSRSSAGQSSWTAYAEALVLARQRGFLTLKGTAYALHTDLAYAPVLEAIGPFLAGLPAGHLSQLVRGLPDLSRLFGNLSLPPPSSLGDPALKRTRLFEAVARLVERWQPIVHSRS